MKVQVELPDAFESLEIELPDTLSDWFHREASSKGIGLPELLAAKTSGLTAPQLAAVRANGKDPATYITEWILTHQRHEIAEDWTPAPRSDAVPPGPEPPPVTIGNWRPVLRFQWLTQPHTVLLGCAWHLDSTDFWVDIALWRRVTIRAQFVSRLT